MISVKTILSSSKDMDLVNFSSEDSLKIDEAKICVDDTTLSRPNFLNNSTYEGSFTVQIHFLTWKTFFANMQLTKLSVSSFPNAMKRSAPSICASLSIEVLYGSP